MLDFLETWWPWLTIAAIPGALNLSIALKELDKQCRSLPFFEPYKSIGFWFWVFVQIGFPSVCFWYDSDLTSQPTTYQKLVIQSLLFGLSFITIFNAEAKIGDQTYNIKERTYKVLVGFAYDWIAKKQTSKTARFWTEIEAKLNEQQNEQNFDAGLRYLSNYFIEDIALEDSIKASRAEQIKKATLAQDNLETIAVIKSLLRTVHRKHLPEALYDFGCSDLCQKYFPNRSLKPLKQLHLGRDI